ncbi:glycosyltransferase WecB/TagA/CpsF family protein [Anopheles sinensis]|uniref:Glycosyltransferase WecB/TagA/CpsF family protein n=1 Tax=Anopheles sinensis TaxID=74873 RepID=A0A084WES9_ANOSI|nr:glycosyltransferase WecB/TagA/CpsF family protein [Anopheles sinensis]
MTSRKKLTAHECRRTYSPWPSGLIEGVPFLTLLILTEHTRHGFERGRNGFLGSETETGTDWRVCRLRGLTFLRTPLEHTIDHQAVDGPDNSRKLPPKGEAEDSARIYFWTQIVQVARSPWHTVV